VIVRIKAWQRSSIRNSFASLAMAAYSSQVLCAKASLEVSERQFARRLGQVKRRFGARVLCGFVYWRGARDRQG
jgi:hypothetical protein